MLNERVARVLLDAEKSLVDLSNEAAKQRDYDRASVLLGLAREIRALAERSEATPNTGAGAIPIKTQRPAKPPERSTGGHANSAPPTRRGRRSEYPQFFREGSSLLKVGYSRHDGEYEHKAPDRVVFGVAEVFAKLGARGSTFTMEAAMPMVGAALGNDVPSYQPYLCLSWLKSTDLIQQHGRKGYSIRSGTELAQRVRARWEQLAPRGASKTAG